MNVRGFALATVRRTARRLRPHVAPHVFDALYGLGHLGYLPRIERPRTFNEKLLWLRRHYRDPRMALLADKLAARRYVADVAPDLRLPELLGVYDDPDAIPFDALPDRAVLKANHGSGFVRVLRKPVDAAAVRAEAARWLARPYGGETKEWMYEGLPRRLFAEGFLGDGAPPDDHKVFMLNGRARFVQVFRGRFERLERSMFDLDWTPLPVYRGVYPGGPLIVPDPARLPPRPHCLERLIELAERVAAPFPFARVDLYVVDEEPVFGEVTFVPNGGHVEFKPVAFDRALGDALTLPR